MIEVLHGQEKEAYTSIKNINGVKDVFPILGEYRLFVMLQAKNKALLYSLIDAIKERPEVASIWHLLISREDVSSDQEFVWPEMNRFAESNYNSSISNDREVVNLEAGH